MGLKETFQAAAKTAVTAFGNVGVSTVYHSIVSATSYNTSSGVNAVSISSVAGVTVIFDEFTLAEQDNSQVESEDKKAFIPAKGPISTITPRVQDRIIDSDGITWNVVSATTDPAGALWTLQVRKS